MDTYENMGLNWTKPFGNKQATKQTVQHKMAHKHKQRMHGHKLC